MKKTEKIKISTELTYIIALVLMAVATAFTERGNFGVSMIVAPAYLLYLKLSTVLPFVTFGMAEYTFQALLLVLMILLMRKFRFSYLFSFVTAVVYGFALDGVMKITELLPNEIMWVRLACFFFGVTACCISVSLFFKTYLSAEVYEMFVKEVSKHFHIPITGFKLMFDISFCVIAIIMSIIFFGVDISGINGIGDLLRRFVLENDLIKGIGLGTVFCAVTNGFIIGWISKRLDAIFEFVDTLPLRKYFEDNEKASENERKTER